MENKTTAAAGRTTSETTVTAKEKFSFPFSPYSIQADFMQNLVETFEESKIGIFESPTGTGKSLSLICGSLTWLLDFETQRRQRLTESIRKIEAEIQKLDSMDDWLTAFQSKHAKEQEKEALLTEMETIRKTDERVRSLTEPTERKKPKQSKRKAEEDDLDQSEADDVDADIALAEYHSDGEADQDDKQPPGPEESCPNVTKIFYCSRTHSQLAQFLQEIRKTYFAQCVRVVTLGSRQNLCVNPTVSRLSNVSLMNDRCIEMQKGKSSAKVMRQDNLKIKRNCKSARCSFYQQEQMHELADQILVKLRDLETTCAMGREQNACPYYGSRFALPLAQLVLLPYQILLHEPTRAAWGINLDNNVIIVDEAHNLLDAVASMYGTDISRAQLCKANAQLKLYVQRFKERLKAKNLLYVRQLTSVIALLIKSWDAAPQSGKTVFGVTEFLLQTNFDDVNIFKLINYMDKSQIAKKLYGFMVRYEPSAVQNTKPKALSGVQKLLAKQEPPPASATGANVDPALVTASPMFQVRSFLEALTSKAEDGRIVIKRDKSNANNDRLQFLLLNPGSRLQSLVTKCRSLVLAGGTMEPADELRDSLLRVCAAPQSRLHRFSCGHVVASDRLLPLIVSHGCNGRPINTSFQSRQKPETVQVLGSVLVNLSRLVPGGLVVFVPSYEYGNFLYEKLEQAGTLATLNNRKRVFREPKSASDVDRTLTDYARCIRNSGGALLLAVVGGKMSEGINFGDELGRCVVLVGLPYPNKNSPELQEKMRYLDGTIGSGAGDQYYVNICLKSVNQSIGRVIRHKEDYASIILLDERYCQTNIKSRLPDWIKQWLQVHDKFGNVVVAFKKFYSSK